MSEAYVEPVLAFIGCPTPEGWIARALQERDILMIDHANCEKKAAATAVNLMFRYPDRRELMVAMAQLAREELLHFEQVTEMMEKAGIPWKPVSASRYANALREQAVTHEPQRLIDTLIIGALIEARSCERFLALANAFRDQSVQPELERYYRFLLKSESRHFSDYLDLARLYFSGEASAFEARVDMFRTLENRLVTEPDIQFRFHSGVPATDS